MYICICCYSSRLAAVYVPSISNIVLIVKCMEECAFSPSGIMFFYLVTRGWNFTSQRIQSISIRRHIERRHVNREELRELLLLFFSH